MATLERGGQDWGRGGFLGQGWSCPEERGNRSPFPGGLGTELPGWESAEGVLGSWQSIPLLGQQQSPLLTLATKQNTTNKFANLPAASHSSGDQTGRKGYGLPCYFPWLFQGSLRMGPHLPLALPAAEVPSNPDYLSSPHPTPSLLRAGMQSTPPHPGFFFFLTSEEAWLS